MNIETTGWIGQEMQADGATHNFFFKCDSVPIGTIPVLEIKIICL